MNYQDFFIWCDERGLNTTKKIAYCFFCSIQTVKNWKETDPNVKLKNWKKLYCMGYDFLSEYGKNLKFNQTDVSLNTFTMWRTKNNLSSFATTAELLGLRRQTIHSWYKKNKLPKWLFIVLVGYEYQKDNNVDLKEIFKF